MKSWGWTIPAQIERWKTPFFWYSVSHEAYDNDKFNDLLDLVDFYAIIVEECQYIPIVQTKPFRDFPRDSDPVWCPPGGDVSYVNYWFSVHDGISKNNILNVIDTFDTNYTTIPLILKLVPESAYTNNSTHAWSE